MCIVRESPVNGSHLSFSIHPIFGMESKISKKVFEKGIASTDFPWIKHSAISGSKMRKSCRFIVFAHFILLSCFRIYSRHLGFLSRLGSEVTFICLSAAQGGTPDVGDNFLVISIRIFNRRKEESIESWSFLHCGFFHLLIFFIGEFCLLVL